MFATMEYLPPIKASLLIIVILVSSLRVLIMRVCLINPPRIQPKLWGKPVAFQPLDIAYVAAVLRKSIT